MLETLPHLSALRLHFLRPCVHSILSIAHGCWWEPAHTRTLLFMRHARTQNVPSVCAFRLWIVPVFKDTSNVTTFFSDVGNYWAALCKSPGGPHSKQSSTLHGQQKIMGAMLISCLIVSHWYCARLHFQIAFAE